MDWANYLEKIGSKKNKKNSKNQSEIAAGEQKTTSEKANFSHSTLKLEQTNFTPENQSLFQSTYCFGVTKITTTI